MKIENRECLKLCFVYPSYILRVSFVKIKAEVGLPDEEVREK